MKKGTFIWTCIGAGLVIIVLVFFNFKREGAVKQYTKTTKVMKDSIRTLNLQNERLTLALYDCQSGKKAVAKKPTAKKPIVKKPAPVVKPTTKFIAPKEEPRKIVVAKAAEPEPIVAADPLAPLRDGNEEILACLRVNGSKDGHFPHYAIDRGATVSNAKDNGRHGYNYVLTPVESISGNVPGVTKEGIFFVPASYLKKYLNMSGESLKYVDLLYKGSWGGTRMTLQGEYYVYYTR